MSSRSDGPVPDSINQLREQLQELRSTRPRRTRLPEVLSLSMTSRSSRLNLPNPLEIKIRPYALRTLTHISRPQWDPPSSHAVPECSRRAARLRSGPKRRQ
jgi:hypothetical protein